MTYVYGFVTPVPAANKDAYRDHSEKAAPMFKEHGALRFVEAWGDDVPDGKRNDFKGAVKAEEGEVVVFSWLEYPSKEACDAAEEKMMADPRMEQMGQSMSFDGKRMIHGGFEPFVDEGSGARGGYFDGYLLPVPAANRDAYRRMAEKAAAIFKEYGATRIVEAWGENLPEGKVTDYKRAVLAEEGEKVVYSWVEWPSKEARDAAWAKIMDDERMKPEGEMPFDGKRMIWGGFRPLVDL